MAEETLKVLVMSWWGLIPDHEKLLRDYFKTDVAIIKYYTGKPDRAKDVVGEVEAHGCSALALEDSAPVWLVAEIKRLAPDLPVFLLRYSHRLMFIIDGMNEDSKALEIVSKGLDHIERFEYEVTHIE